METGRQVVTHCIREIVRLLGEPGSAQVAELEARFAALTLEISGEWTALFLSDRFDETLKRNFRHDLEGIRDCLDTFFASPPLTREQQLAGNKLQELISFVRRQFPGFFPGSLIAPVCYHVTVKEKIISIREQALSKAQHFGLAPVLRPYIDHFFDDNENSRYTYEALSYYELMLGKIAAANSKPQLVHQLLAHNFNALEFFEWYCSHLRENLRGRDTVTALRLLRDEKIKLQLMPDKGTAYDLSWPPVHAMLTAWISEEIDVLKQVAPNTDPSSGLFRKVKVNLSVAHLGLLIRLFVEENLLPGIPLTEIFRLTAAHIRSRRQETISARSLSKEYYSNDQVTAAVVKDLLHKMIIRINRQFFPVWFAISATILSFS